MALLALLHARPTEDAHARGFPPPTILDATALLTWLSTPPQASERVAQKRILGHKARATRILRHSKRHATAPLSFAALWGTHAGMQACRQVSAWGEGR